VEVLSDQQIGWCCIDPLNWHDLPGLETHTFGVAVLPLKSIAASLCESPQKHALLIAITQFFSGGVLVEDELLRHAFHHAATGADQGAANDAPAATVFAWIIRISDCA
jgi:hypothetical protein